MFSNLREPPPFAPRAIPCLSDAIAMHRTLAALSLMTCDSRVNLSIMGLVPLSLGIHLDSLRSPRQAIFRRQKQP